MDHHCFATKMEVGNSTIKAWNNLRYHESVNLSLTWVYYYQ